MGVKRGEYRTLIVADRGTQLGVKGLEMQYKVGKELGTNGPRRRTRGSR